MLTEEAQRRPGHPVFEAFAHGVAMTPKVRYGVESRGNVGANSVGAMPHRADGSRAEMPQGLRNRRLGVGIVAGAVLACAGPQPTWPAEVQVNPNRPTHAITADTIPPGMVQLETGVSFLRDATGTQPFRQFSVEGNPRFGLVENLEVSVDSFFLRDRGEGQDTSGLGDTTLAAKWHILDDEGWRPAFALQPFVKLPTASREKGLGSGRVDFGGTFVAGKTLFGNLTLLPNVSLVGVSLTQDPGGVFLQKTVAFPIFWSITEKITPFWEIFYQSRDRPSGDHGVMTDFGLIYIPHWRIALDIAGQFRITGTAPDWVVRGGLTLLLGARPGPAPSSE